MLRTLIVARAVLVTALLPLVAAPLAAQARAGARRADIPAAYTAIREADLRRDVGEMASPAMRGREGGTLDEMRASMWVAEQYRRIGLEPMGDDGTWFQWFDIVRTRVSTTASRASIGARAMTLFGDMVPLNVVPAEASGAVLWVPDAADTTADVRGRIVATPLLPAPPAAIRPTSYTFASRLRPRSGAARRRHISSARRCARRSRPARGQRCRCGWSGSRRRP